MNTAMKWLGLVLGLTVARSAVADEGTPGAMKVNFEEHVKPIFREHCFSCHNQDTKKSDLQLDSFAALMRGGASGEVIEPGDPDGSRLFQLVAHLEEPKMPPKQDRLADAKLQLIKAWIAAGALETAGSKANAPSKPAVDLKAASSGGKKPDGPPPMPAGLSRQPAVYTPRAAAITALAASPWAPLVAVAGQKQICLYHSESLQLLGVLPFPEGIPQVLKFSRNGTLLLAGGGHAAQLGKAVVYDVKTGQRVFEVGEEVDAVLAADINENHTLIALGGPSKVVRIFSTADGALVHEIRKHTDWIYALEFSPDGVLLATADRSGGLFVWEADTAREYQNLASHKGPITDVSWRGDSNLLASCSEDGTIKLWELENGREVKSWGAHGGGVMSLEFARDGRLVSTGRDRVTKLWDAGGAQQRAFEALPELAMRVAVTHDGSRVIAGDWSGLVRVDSAADGKQVGQLPANPPTLEMLVQSQSAAAAAAHQAVEKAAAELVAADAELAAKAKAAADVSAKAAAAKAESEKRAAELVAAAQALAEQTKALAAAADEPARKAADAAWTAAQAASDGAAKAAKSAAEAASAVGAQVPAAAAAAAQAKAARDAKAAAHQAAQAAAGAAQEALDRATAEKAAFDKAQPAQQAAK